ncbi:hypothetical protein [Intestinibacter bartlettii]|uniref:hypothetical protein n=1 Tax=Intestinibacter bartlettii TaxID=261299 RepID=UPI002676E985|nr:hypothetical protein [Intestinibacter bartlettii]
MSKETSDVLQSDVLQKKIEYKYAEERVIFIISKIALLSISILSIFLTGTHEKNLFVCSFVYMLTVFSDYLSLYRSIEKTDKSKKISTGLFILCSIFIVIFFIAMIVPMEVSEDLKYIIFLKTNREFLFKLPYIIVELITYILMILASSFYIIEMTGVLNRKSLFLNKNQEIIQNR